MALRVARDYQCALRDFALDRARVNWWAGTGTGKTSSGLDTFDFLHTFGEVNHMLVISTKRIAKLVWQREVQKWENFRHLTTAVAVGDPEQRIAALKRRAHITTINFDNLPWLIEKAGDEWYWDMVIADESTRLKGLRIDVRKSSTGKVFQRKSGGGSRAYALASVAHKKVRRWINATGTPAPNGLIDLWGQQWFVDGGQSLGRSFSAFKDRWFKSVQLGDDRFAIRLEPHEWSDAEIKARIAESTITIDAADYFDLPPTIHNIIKVPLPPRAKAIYQKMEKELFAMIDNHEVEAFNAGAKSMKCRQIASGAAYIEEDDGSDTKAWVPVHDEKLDALEDIINEANGEPVMCAYQFKSDLARLKKRFPQGVFFDDNPATLKAFEEGKIPLLFLHPQSAAHGIDGMQENCRTIVIFSMTWNLEDLQQVIERIGATRQAQSGHYREVRVHYLIAEDTVEEVMYDRSETKASVQDSLKAYAKRKKC